jgi:predicted metal-dependent hydrolase
MITRKSGDIEYLLLRSNLRRTADIILERDGTITVRAPRHFSDDRVDQIIEKKRYWIYKNLAEWRDLNVTRVVREFRNGEGFLYLGRSYRLSLVIDQDEPLTLKNGRFRLQRQIAEAGDVVSRAAFRDFYCNKGKDKLPQRVNSFEAKVGVAVKEVCVRDLGFRWASCNAKGKLAFHWKCMMAPLMIIDYIVVHELCHLRYRDHTQAFWNEIDKVMPDYQERKAWLRENGASIDL